MQEVLKAVSAAMASVKTVAKLGKNSHDKYAFASIDDFLGLVNPVCAEAELTILCNEVNIEDFTRKGKYGENPWIRATFSFTVYHSSGQSLPAVIRTVEVLRNGAQAYGSAQSYALKQFLRSLFLIPTGDKDDADLMATATGNIPVQNIDHHRQDNSSGPSIFDLIGAAKTLADANGLIPQVNAMTSNRQQATDKLIAKVDALGGEYSNTAGAFVKKAKPADEDPFTDPQGEQS